MTSLQLQMRLRYEDLQWLLVLLAVLPEAGWRLGREREEARPEASSTVVVGGLA